MKIFALMALIGLAGLSPSSQAVIPANPRTIMGIDHIKPHELGVVLREFCKTNGCIAKLDRDSLKYGYGWSLYIGKPKSIYSSSVLGIGDGCARIPHRYCAQIMGTLDAGFMTKVRLVELKRLLESKGAKVTLMDCKVTARSFPKYACANGKPPP
jgi:hypothetical protein